LIAPASANAGQSSAWPSGLSTACASRATLLRQSTSVPNTSKNNALTDMGISRTSSAE